MISRTWAVPLLAAALLGIGVAAPVVPRPSPEFVIKGFNGQVLLSQFRGKTVLLAFIQTTCPHCQNSVGILSRIQGEYGSRGFQALAAAFNEMAAQLLPEFVNRFRPGFPVGFASRESVTEYLQIPSNVPFNVPTYVFIDKKGVIQGQHTGGGKFFEAEERNIRITLDALLKEPAQGGKKGPAPKKH